MNGRLIKLAFAACLLAGAIAAHADESDKASLDMESFASDPSAKAQEYMNSSGDVSVGVFAKKIQILLEVQLDPPTCVLAVEYPASGTQVIHDEGCDSESKDLPRDALNFIYSRTLEDIHHDPLVWPEQSHAFYSAKAFLAGLAEGNLHTPTSEALPDFNEYVVEENRLLDAIGPIAGDGEVLAASLRILRGDSKLIVNVASGGGHCLFSHTYDRPSEILANRWSALVDNFLGGEAPTNALYLDRNCDAELDLLRLDGVNFQSGKDLSPALWQSLSRNYTTSLYLDYIRQFEFAVQLIRGLDM